MKSIGLSIIVCFVLFSVYSEENSEPLAQLLTRKRLDILLNEGEVVRVFTDEKSPVLIPEIKAKEYIMKEVQELDPMIGVEIVLLFKTGDGFAEEQDRELVLLFNILQSISTMKGIEYYSATRKRMRIFYHDAYVINSPEEKIKIDDPVVENNVNINGNPIPEKSDLFAYLADSSFGKYICHIEYSFDGEAFIMRMKNLTQIWYTVIPLINPSNLRSYIVIIPVGDNILFYGLSCLRTINLFGMAKNRWESLYNRIKAVYDWFQVQYKNRILP